MATATKAKPRARKAYEGPSAEEKLVSSLVELLESGVNPWRKLQRANTICREKELAALNLHESDKVGPVTRAEAWETFRKWEQHENETVQVLELLSATGVELGFSAFTRF